MDQMHNDGLVNASVFGDGQHIPYDDNMFPTGDDHSHFNDASWGVNASTYQQPVSRAASAHAVPSWPQHASHVSASNTPTNFHGQSSVYARPPLHSPASFAQNHTYPGFGSANFNNFNQPHSYAQALPQENINQAFQQYNPQPTNSTSITPQPLVSAAQQVVDPADRSQSAFNYPILPQQQQQQPAQQPSQQPSQQPTQQQSQQPSQQPTQQALQQPSQQPSQQTPTGPVASITLAQPTTGHQTLARAIPASQQHGRFTIIDLPQLVRDTNSERFAAFATIGRRAQDFPVNRSTALPPYVKRNSRNELKRLARNDPKIMARLSAKNSLLGRSSAGSPRSTNAASPTLKNAQLGENIKYESESESEFESDNVSLYSDEEDDVAGAPLPAKKPEDAKGAVEYDTIKALWRNKRKTTDATSIRKGLGDFWEILKTIRDRWKTDIKAVEEAEEKKRVGDLALLKSRVKDQRDMLEVAFRAALKHGFRSIIELFSENAPFLYLCYQFLLDRFKAEDLNGQVSRMILEILSITTTITDEKLDRTFLGKVLPRYVKKGDGKTKFYARKILEGSASNSKGKQTKPDTESTAGVKRSSSTAGNATAPAPAKKPAVTASTSNGNGAASKTAATVKKPADATKPGTTAAPAATAKTKTVQAKPSNFFAGLQSVGKKPGTANGDKPAAKPATQRPSAAAPAKPAFNLAETLANLAKPKEEVKKPEPKPDTSKDNESPERKAKRVARLARGATGVRWKDAQDLVEIRFFSHDPAEELDHDASQMRDVKDVGGEGRMLKQHADMMDVDEDEDSAEDDNNSNFVTFIPPSEVDFSTVDQEDRDRQYAPYGGGKLQPDSPERKIREQYERDNLIVIYSDASEIPPNPREPADPYNGEEAGPCMEFGAPPDHYFRRANHRRPAKMPAPANAAPAPAPIAPIAGLDLGALFAAAQQAPQPAQPAQPAAPPLSYTDYLAQFHPEAAAAPPPQPQQHFSGFPQAPVLPQPQFQPQQQAAPARPNGEPDIAAILAALNAANMNNAAAPAQPAAPAPVPFAFQPGFANMFGNAGYQQQPQQQGNAGGDKPHPNYKTKVCKYWQEGKCKKGDECTYLHK